MRLALDAEGAQHLAEARVLMGGRRVGVFMALEESDFHPCFRPITRLHVSADFASMSQKTLVIVPTYNERANLPSLIKRLMAQPAPVEILVVDGNSPDGTGKLAEEVAA